MYIELIAVQQVSNRDFHNILETLKEDQISFEVKECESGDEIWVNVSYIDMFVPYLEHNFYSTIKKSGVETLVFYK